VLVEAASSTLPRTEAWENHHGANPKPRRWMPRDRASPAPLHRPKQTRRRHRLGTSKLRTLLKGASRYATLAMNGRKKSRSWRLCHKQKHGYRFNRFRISDNSLRIATVLTSSAGNPAARESSPWTLPFPFPLPFAMRLSSLLRAPLMVKPCS